MKRLPLIVFTLILLLGQWGSLDHAYHEHNSGENCDYCISAKSLDNAINTSLNIVFSQSCHQCFSEPNHKSITLIDLRYYAVRAPPHII